MAAQPFFAAQCDEVTGDLCWTWCPVPPPTAVPTQAPSTCAYIEFPRFECESTTGDLGEFPTAEDCIPVASASGCKRFDYNRDSGVCRCCLVTQILYGSLTIQNGVTSTGLARLSSLKKVCGTVTLQQLNTQTLDGLDNLEIVTGSLTVQQNTFNGGAADFLTSFGLDSLSYVGGNLFFSQNYYAEDLGGNFGPLVVAGVNLIMTRYPGCPAQCPDEGDRSSVYENCQIQCGIGKNLNQNGGFTSNMLPANDPKCEAITPTPSPVAGPVGPDCVDLCLAVYNSILNCGTCQGSGEKCWDGANCIAKTGASCPAGRSQCTASNSGSN